MVLDKIFDSTNIENQLILKDNENNSTFYQI